MIVPHRRLLGVCRDSASCIQPEDAAVNGFGSGLNGQDCPMFCILEWLEGEL